MGTKALKLCGSISQMKCQGPSVPPLPSIISIRPFFSLMETGYAGKVVLDVAMDS